MQIKKRIQTICIKLRVDRCIAWLLCVAMIGSMMNLALPVLAANTADSENAADSENTVDSENTADSENAADSENTVDSENTADSENSVESEGTYCEHHTEHTEECGYVEAVEGQPCTHEHDEECGYVEGGFCTHEHDGECGYVEGQPCTHVHDEECGYSETSECSHTHDEECGYVEGQPCTHTHDEQCGNSEVTECSHEHDENCGYVEAVEGQPCRFVCEICGGGSEEAAEEEPGEDSEQSVNVLAAEPMAAAQEKGLIAAFTFDKSDRLKNSANSGVTADLYSITAGQAALGSKIESGSWESGYFDGTGDKEDALHLENNACLVLDHIDAFKGLDELTVEMRVNIPEAQTQNWLLYASPEGDSAENTNNSFGAVITNSNKQLRAIRNNAYLVTWDSSDVLVPDKWHTIRIVYKVSTMALYIDNKRVAEYGAGGRTADYFTDDTAIWLGHSAWASDKDFNGYIDDIKIYNYAKDDHVIDEKAYIRTATEPPSTTVNMFDYWIEGKEKNDFRTELNQEFFLNSGINKDHLFLFAGSDASNQPSQSNKFSDNVNIVGTWNNYLENGHNTWEPYQGIVKSELDSGGYPQLAIDELNVVIPDALNNRGTEKQTESLAYLFDTKQSHDGKAAYSNVSGLFQLGDDGYYSFRSNETFAELNIDQKSGQKKSKNNNHVTLYAEPWNIYSGGNLGQFFPFNDGSNLFYAADSGEPIQAHSTQKSELSGQSTTAEPMNHYFGMTVTTQFTQPTDGLLHYYDGTQPMTFEFSGDDDVWIFIDGVLVGDLGGLHQRVRITIDYATGIIDYTGNLLSDGINGDQDLGTYDTNLYHMFEKANKQDTVNWKIVNAVDEQGEAVEHKLFPDGSKHTLKFFYLERGNNMSNCSIRFNLHDYPVKPSASSNPPKKDGSENSPAEQPPEEEQAVYLSAGQDVAATPSAEQPQAEESEAKILGVLGSPNTGDSNMTGLWLTLLVFSSAGLVAIHYRTRKR